MARNQLTAVHGIVLYLAVAWKACHLSRAPRDQPLRWVTACLICAALAYPAGIVAAVRPAIAGGQWLTFFELACLLGPGYALYCFFLFSLRPAPIARAQARRRAVPFAVIIGVLAVSAALTPVGTRMNDLAIPAVAGSYLAFDISISCLLADGWILARHGARAATGPLARGLRMAAADTALMVTGASLLAVDIVFHWTRARDPAWLALAANLLVIPGIIVFITGICYPGAVMRVHALRVWARHRRVYRELAPLWTMLHQAFPQDALTRVPARRLSDRLSLRGVHWRYYRRIIECGDGLVRISPHLAQHGHTGSYQQVADHLLAAMRSLPTVPPEASQAVPIAIPASPGLDADAAELVRLSRELAAAIARTRIPKPRRGTSMERTPTT